MENKAAVSIVNVSSSADVFREVSREIKEYSIVPGGNTALLDGLYYGTFIANRYLDKFDRTLMICISDGEENSSRFATWELVDHTVGKLNGTDKFTIAYYGTIESLAQVAKGLKNIHVDNTYKWDNTIRGTQKMNQRIGASASAFYASGATSATNFATSGDND